MKVTKTSEEGIELIKSFEGLVLKPYKCSAGVPTIGYGNTFYENGRRLQWLIKQLLKQEPLNY